MTYNQRQQDQQQINDYLKRVGDPTANNRIGQRWSDKDILRLTNLKLSDCSHRKIGKILRRTTHAIDIQVVKLKEEGVLG